MATTVSHQISQAITTKYNQLFERNTMKKTLLLAATAALVSMPSLANENYIAVELGAGSYTTSGQDANSDVINDDTGF